MSSFKRSDYIILTAVIVFGAICFTALNTFEPGTIWR